ncbi:MAG: hypothetical protein Q7R41_06965 [Phycisphaerales bacterium]|nr:hypothetical protein [Phycisphaerales bacterium]
MMLVTAAVLSVGVGSYWFFGRDSGEERPVASVEADTMRKPRAAADAPAPPRKPTPALPSEDGAAVGQRKPPPEPENTNTERKPRPRPVKSGTNKPVRLPAG